jgi:hypothetical protein
MSLLLRFKLLGNILIYPFQGIIARILLQKTLKNLPKEYKARAYFGGALYSTDYPGMIVSVYEKYSYILFTFHCCVNRQKLTIIVGQKNFCKVILQIPQIIADYENLINKHNIIITLGPCFNHSWIGF